MRRQAAALILWSTLASAQNIFTVAGIPYSHRNSVDSQAALKAPLGAVYGLLIDKTTGRLLFHDEFLVLRLESDGSLLAVAGAGPRLNPGVQVPGTGTPASDLASTLSVAVLRGIAQDAAGVLYLSDASAGKVYRVGPEGKVTTYAGGGLQPDSLGDGGPATAARLQSPRGLVFDSKGNLDIAEPFCNCIRQVSPGGIISTLYTFPPSTTPPRVRNVEGLTIDAKDNLYVTEFYGNVVVKVAADGSGATTIAGTGAAGFSGDGGAAISAQLDGPSGVTLDKDGNLYLAETNNHRIRMVAANGTIRTIAGTGTCGFSGDGGTATAAQLCSPAETLFDAAGNLLIADYGNRRVRRMAPDGTVTTIAGSGTVDPRLSYPGTSGDGGPQIRATFDMVGGIAFDSSGNWFVSETLGNVIRRIAPDGTVSTYAGTGRRGIGGEGGPATQADLFNPGPLAVGPDGALYLVSGDSRIRKVTPDGTIHLVAGTGPGTGLNRAQGDGGPAVNATLNEPGGVAFNAQGEIFIADTSNARVRKIDRNGVITTVAGPGQQGADYYNAVAVDGQGNLYVAWTRSVSSGVEATVNRVNADGSLTRVAGSGEPCAGGPGAWAGDGVAATQARLCAVVGLVVDRNGVMHLSEGGYSLVLQMQGGTIQRAAGSTAAAGIGDGGPALDASLAGGQTWSPGTVAFDRAGNLYIPEAGLNVIREVTRTAYQLEVSPSRIDAAGSMTQRIAVAGNFQQPFPYSVRVSTTEGGAWLTANRTTGLTGEAITVAVNAAGLGRGTYRGSVSVAVSVPGFKAMEIPVALTVP